MYRTFTIYIQDNKNVSENLLEVLGFIDYANRGWLRDENNSAVVDTLLHALTDIGYKWVVEFEYETVFEEGKKRFETIQEWAEWYDN